MSDVDWAALESAAIHARGKAYAPYSRYHVGAAVLTDDGRVFVGCNVENASYGLTICAERTAVVTMVAAGEQRIRAVAVVTAGPEAGAPCGACRQVLGEFTDDAVVHMLAVDEKDHIIARRESSVDALLPGKFRGEQVFAATKA